MTKNGKMILEIIRESEDHMTAEQIFMKAKEISPRIVLATVYNNLNSLVVRRAGAQDKAGRQPRQV